MVAGFACYQRLERVFCNVILYCRSSLGHDEAAILPPNLLLGRKVDTDWRP